MHSKTGKASYGLRWGVFTLITAFVAVSAATGPADARSKRKSTKTATVLPYSPPYSDIVIDANSGAVMHSTSPDSPRHPASLTKIMTLYMLFEQLEAGKVSLRTQFPVSAHAASQAPSKLRLKPGETISVEDSIRALVTKSANDVAVVIAEAIGGEEDNFARLMTAKARAIGMQNTVYKNASGLPDDAQITTARDQALLGRVIQERFPQYYGYFATTRFSFRGKSIAGHNRLVGRVEGVDGIKTGYVNASGFNLVSSMRRDGRHLVAVVLGGRSASSRDAKMRDLLTDYVRTASVKRTGPVLAEAPAPQRTAMQRLAEAVVTPARAAPAPIPLPRPAPAAAEPASVPAADYAPGAMAAAVTPGSSDPLEPVMVKTVPVKPGIQNVFLAAPITTASVTPPAHARGPEMAFADPAQDAPRAPDMLAGLPVKLAPAASAAEAAEMMRTVHRSGWLIQVGAFDTEGLARQRLTAAQERAKSLLGAAEAFTERVVKGDKTLFRARFAGFEKDQAEAACKHLKKNEIACMTLKN